MYSSNVHEESLTANIHSFNHWKKDLARSLGSFRLWLGRNELYSKKVDNQLSDLLKFLKNDYVTIAFAGEYSRGKTELINAMFFANYGQRILPSQAGRTTMCPTELFFDQNKNQTYLKLLPIETRSDSRPLESFRHLDDYWINKPLNTDSAESMVQTLQMVTETKNVSLDIAEKLGFSGKSLQLLTDDNLVEIPKWRHALISFDHPLLRQGLRILDTPGLNALGSEPELTLSLLPQAQAVIFLLAADAGVTASDMAIWDEHISQLKNRSNLGLYAVLNKVDVLWDELNTDQQIQDNIDKVILNTSRQLELSQKNIFPVSAQKGLLARVKNDASLLEKSQLESLEKVLTKAIMQSKERSLWENVIADTHLIVRDSLDLLQNRKQQLLMQRNDLYLLKDSTADQITHLVAESNAARQKYQQKIYSIKPSLRLMEKQAELLKNCINGVNLQQAIDKASQSMLMANSTYAMIKSMREFYFSVDAIMIGFSHEADLTNKMAISIFERFQTELGLSNFSPRLFTAKQYHRDLKLIIRDSDQFNRHLKLALSGQNRVVFRFFNTTVQNINNFFEMLTTKLDNWAVQILHPLAYQIEDHKKTLQTHLDDLKCIQQKEATATGSLRALNIIVNDLDDELSQCKNTLNLLNKFQKTAKDSNVIPFLKNNTQQGTDNYYR